MRIVIIAAVAANGTIGHAGKIPWHISDDLKRFKRFTLGHPVIMGRKTYESLGKPLPDRRNIILTHQPGPDHFPSLDAALRYLATLNLATVFVAGGAEVYRTALPVADTLLLTEVHQKIAGDTKFPAYNRSQWQEINREEHPGFAFVEYRRL
jgi:dihydrofolate reductase